MPEEILVERQATVLRVTLNRPEKHNALSRSVLDGLRQIFEENAGDESLQAVVLSGAGDQSFAAGGDLKDLSVIRTLSQAREMAEQAKSALNAVRDFPVPVIAALNGNAMGGGAELAAACDFRIAAMSARIGFVQGRLNISTAWGGGVDLMRLVGPDRALHLLCSSEMLTPSRALALGLYDEVAKDVDGLATTVDLFLQPFLRQVPQVLRTFKDMVKAARRGDCLADLHALETEHFARNWVHPDHWAAADKVFDKSKGEE
ncbi:MAG: 3-hydroxybutyryl-CoA dehydratase [Gammaproteobacteria bacterium]|jgi:enoyl-CoA hydratase|nr:3-hydroxybutyryl-CoA dehydratase [Gammaproteobacteria bacterium]|tara:strand:+ start:1140 stop:1919 length:780 start_codon:yes stop_codon:yes gene_type:complete